MSDANRVRTLYGLEATYGEFAGRDLFTLRMTGESLKSAPTYVASAELRADRQRSDQILQDFKADGGFNFELSYAAFDVPMALLLQAPLVTIEASGNSVSASTTDDSFNTTGTWDLQPPAGTVIYVTGFADDANNGWHRVVSSTTTKIVVASNLVTESAPSASVVQAIWPTNEVALTGQFSVVAKGGNDWPTITRGSGSFVSDGLVAGNWIRTKKCAITGNNTYMKLVSVAATTLEVMPATSNGDLTADAASAVVSAAAVSTSQAGKTYTKDSGSWAVTPTVGTQILVSGFSDGDSNGVKTVAAATSSVITVEEAIGADEAGVSATIVEVISLTQGTMIENGIAFNTLSIVREHQDLTNKFKRFLGMGVNTFTLNVATNGILTGSFGFEGKSEEAAASLGGTAVAAPANRILNSVRHVKAVFEGFTKFGVTSITLNVNNNLAGRREVASLGPVSVRSGTIDVTGSLQMYYSDAAAAIDAKALADEASSSAVIVDDDSGTTYGNGYIFDYPRFKYTSYTSQAGGINQDVFLNTDWSSYAHETENKTMRIVKFAAD